VGAFVATGNGRAAKTGVGAGCAAARGKVFGAERVVCWLSADVVGITGNGSAPSIAFAGSVGGLFVTAVVG
jgi:hypothetical protein